MTTRHAIVNVAAKRALGTRHPDEWVGTADIRSSDGSLYFFVVFSERSFPSPEEARDYARRMATETFGNLENSVAPVPE